MCEKSSWPAPYCESLKADNGQLPFLGSSLILVYMFRVFRGPTVYDRILGLNGISTKAIIVLTILGSLNERLEMFVDIALGYAVLNIVSGLSVAKYLEHKETPEC